MEGGFWIWALVGWAFFYSQDLGSRFEIPPSVEYWRTKPWNSSQAQVLVDIRERLFPPRLPGFQECLENTAMVGLLGWSWRIMRVCRFSLESGKFLKFLLASGRSWGSLGRISPRFSAGNWDVPSGNWDGLHSNPIFWWGTDEIPKSPAPLSPFPRKAFALFMVILDKKGAG